MASCVLLPLIRHISSQPLSAACAVFDFRTANTHQLLLANFDWNEYRELVKGLKGVVSIGLKKYPTPPAQ